MAPIRTQWTRLIRFVAAETKRVHIGQPVNPNLDVGIAAANRQPIKAYEIMGSALDPSAELTKQILTVDTLLSPLSNDQIRLVRCLGLNYSDHAVRAIVSFSLLKDLTHLQAEAKLSKPAFPILFYKPLTSLIGPLASVIIPQVAQPSKEHLPDYEVELVIVIGKAAKDVSEAEALDYVLGYTGANDVSFRKHQMAVSQWGFSKGFDNTNPLGPCLVSNNLIPDPQSVELKLTLNGNVVQDGTTADQIFNVRQTVSFLSQGTTLEPGSIILTGTPKGVGFVRNPPLYLKHGDKMAVWLSRGIGTLLNDVKEEQSLPRSRL